MGEVVHLSFGPQANNLNASFYNLQESYFVYTPEEAFQSQVNPRIRFTYGKEFTPFAVFWDFRNGLGNWHRFLEKYEEPESRDEIIQSQGRPVNTAALEPAKKSSSWTDRLRVSLHPSNLHEIPDWEVDALEFPYGKQRGAPTGQDNEFSLVSQGVEEFNEVSRLAAHGADDYLDFTFRHTIEKCDQLGGVNVVTDFGGWAGFSGTYLEILRDEFIPKTPVFTWAISREFAGPRIPLSVRQSRLQALATFSEFSSLVLPLQDAKGTNFESNAAYHMKTFETLCLMSSLRHNPVPMYQLHEELTLGAPKANIIQAGRTIEELDGKARNVRNLLTVERSAVKPRQVSPEVNSQNVISTSSHHWCSQQYNGDAHVQAKFELNDNPLKLRKLVQYGNHELKELVYDLTDDYIWRWDEDSDGDSF